MRLFNFVNLEYSLHNEAIESTDPEYKNKNIETNESTENG